MRSVAAHAKHKVKQAGLQQRFLGIVGVGSTFSPAPHKNRHPGLGLALFSRVALVLLAGALLALYTSTHVWAHHAAHQHAGDSRFPGTAAAPSTASNRFRHDTLHVVAASVGGEAPVAPVPSSPAAAAHLQTVKSTMAAPRLNSTTTPRGSRRTTAGGGSRLSAVVTAAHSLAQDPGYMERLRKAAASPINIAVMTSLFWTLPVEGTAGCKVEGIPLDCHIQSGGTTKFLDKADALYYHVPSFGGKPRPKAFPNQLRLAMSLESAAYYPSLDDPRFMCQFDAEMSYRTCAQVINWYSLEALDKLFQVQAIPFGKKLHAVAYVNSNCGAQSGRSDIMRKLMAMGDKAKVAVHSLGRCDNNKPWPEGNPNKVEVFRRYKFCIAMENSVRQDYMTEKLWDALAAGCVPIYMGSKNAPEIAPANSMIVYDPSGSGDASTPEQLDALMHELGSNEERYQAMLAWKAKQPEQQSSEVFRHLWDVRHTSGECFLCQFLVRHRADPKPHYTTCLFNKEWMDTAGQKFVPEGEACPVQQPVVV